LYLSTYFADKSLSPGIEEQRNSYNQYLNILVLLIHIVLRQIAKDFLTSQYARVNILATYGVGV